MSKFHIIGFRMSKFDIPPEFECQNRISNVKILYSVPIRVLDIILSLPFLYKIKAHKINQDLSSNFFQLL